MQNKLVYNFC